MPHAEADDRIKALRFEHPSAIPVAVGILPSAWMKHREALDGIVRRHPAIFGEQGGKPRDYDAVWSPTYHAGEHTDSWGCVWSNVCEGMEAIVTRHPLPTRADVRRMKPPASVTGAMPHGFMYLRLADLRGFEELMLDFAEEPPELQHLIDTVLAHNLRELDLRLTKHRDPVIYFGDDLGMQHALPVSPTLWRKYLKPCYAAIYAPCLRRGLHVYMHTDGHIHEIIPDLVDCGVAVVNPQVRANGLDNLLMACKGKVCVDLDLDRQLFPFTDPAGIAAHVAEAVDALGSADGGLWLRAEIGPDVPLENVEAICAALERERLRFTPSTGSR